MENLERQVCEMIVSRLGLEDVDPGTVAFDAPLFTSYDLEGIGLGLDSVDALELVVGIRAVFGVSVTDSDMSIFQNVNTISEFIRSKLEQREEVCV
ncbi:MAG: phosphopantetheine-binding protein [Clostridia bacterium]